MADLYLRLLISAQDSASAVIRALGSHFKPVGVGLAAVGVAAMVAGVEAVKMAGNFQQATTALITSAGESAQNIEMVRAGILSLSVSTATSTQQLTAGMYMIESAGFHGAAGLAVLKAAAEGAKAENADLGAVANTVTSALNAYSLSSSSATAVTNSLVATVASGKMHMQDLATSLANVLPAASAAHVGLYDVEGAIATMTMQGDNAANAATHLRQMILALVSPSKAGASSLAAIGLSTQQVASEMKVSLPGALIMITDALKKKFPEGSSAYITALKNIAGGSKQMMAMLELTGSHLSTFGANVKTISGQVRAGGSSILGFAEVQGELNFKLAQVKNAFDALMITLGTKLLPVITPIVGTIAQIVSAFTGWIASGQAVSSALGFLSQHAQVMVPLLAGIGAAIAVGLVTAFIALGTAALGAAIPVVAATAPLLLLAGAVAILVAIFQHFYQTSAAFRAFISGLVAGLRQAWSVIAANFVPAMQRVGQVIQSQVLPILQHLGSWLVSVFAPVWQQLVSVWQSQLVPTWNLLVSSLRPALPLFQLLGTIVGAVLVLAFGVLIGILTGVVRAFANLIGSVAIIIGGIVKIIAGGLAIIGGVLSFFTDLFTGKFNKLGADLMHIMQGIITMFSGGWDVISGVFRAAAGVIWGLVSGFVEGIIGFFTHLWSTLVGHSIIPDMVNGIITWFRNLITQGIALVTSLVSGVLAAMVQMEVQVLSTVTLMVSIFLSWVNHMSSGAVSTVQGLVASIASILGNLGSIALSAGQSLMHGLVSGIQSMIGSVGSAMSSVVSYIGSFLPHSPAKQGELAHLNEYGPNLVKGFADGIVRATPQLQTALNVMMAPIAGAMRTPGASMLPAPTPVAHGPVTIHLSVNPQQMTQTEMDRAISYMGDRLRAQFGNI